MFFFCFFTPDEKCIRKQPSRASISMKFGALIALPKSYISIKFGTIPSKFEEDMTDIVDKFFTDLLSYLLEKLLAKI